MPVALRLSRRPCHERLQTEALLRNSPRPFQPAVPHHGPMDGSLSSKTR